MSFFIQAEKKQSYVLEGNDMDNIDLLKIQYDSIIALLKDMDSMLKEMNLSVKVIFNKVNKLK
jgi:hypothetical protein